MLLERKVVSSLDEVSYRVGGFEIDRYNFKQLVFAKLMSVERLQVAQEIVYGVSAGKAERLAIELKRFGKSKNKQEQYKKLYSAYTDAYEIKKILKREMSERQAEIEKYQELYELVLSDERKNPR